MYGGTPISTSPGYGFSAFARWDGTGTLLGYVVLLGLMGLLGSVFLSWLERRMAPWRLET